MKSIVAIRRLLVIAIVMLGCVVFSAPAERGPEPVAAQGRSAAPIHLVNRNFVPAPGIEAAFAEHAAGSTTERVHGIVQTDGTSSDELRQALADRDVQLLHYIPNNAWLASLPSDPAALDDLPGVRAIVHLRAGDKRSPTLAKGVPEWARRSGDSAALWVSFHSDVDEATAQGVLDAANARVTAHWPDANRYEVVAPSAAISDLGTADAIRWISDTPPPKETTNDGARTYMGVDAVQSAGGPTGAGVQVGEWDEGQVGSHGDLAQVSIVDTAAAVSDHATHVAGTVVGSGTLEPRARGIAPGAELFSFDWDNPVVEHDTAAGLGVEVSTNSWIYGADKRSNSCYGQYTYNAPDFDAIMRGRYGKEILILFAAGNSQSTRNNCSRSGYDKIHVPATAKNIITVGAIHSNDGSMTSFSSWGPTDDGRVKPEVVGPGCQSNGDGGIYSTLPGDQYAAWCGTSMATPATSGVAAMLYEAWRDAHAGGDPNVDPLPSTIKAVLAGTATDLGNTGPDYRHGFGAVDANRAVALLASGDGVLESRDGLSTGNTDTFALQPAGGPLRVTLAWSDVEAVENASKTLINDLDLELIAPDGASHMPWVLQGNRPEEPAGRGVDATNVVEQVSVASPADGVWTVRVSGTDIPMGPQHYSLVIDGAAPAENHDVSVASLRAPSSAATGFTYDVEVDVANEGTFDETAVEVTLEDVTAGTLIGTQSIDLLAGDAATLTFGWIVPSDATLGDHQLRASVTPVADETDTADNERTVTVTVREAVHDVAVQGVSTTPSTAAPGDVVDVIVSVLNEGDYEETFDVSVSESPDGDDLGSQSVTLAPAAAADLTFKWLTSASTSLGTHTLEATAAAVAGESDLSDNVASATVSVQNTATVTRSVTAGADDAGFSCALELHLNEVTFGEDSDCRPKAYHTAAFRFADLQIPNGATIQSARVEFTSASNYDQLITTRIAMEDTADADPFGADRSPDTLTTTAVDVPWEIVGAWGYLDRVASVDFASALQSVVDRADWASGNAAAVVVTTQDASGGRFKHRRVFAFERDAGEAATLIVDYAP